ncbi:hypothetical protein AGMMS49960_17530 [Betaproteobacteria bacterium]|nr:hypothetical protein AGMMS49543_09780 [Betaproteobacteria bacterium]GHU03340.1 hypothetical protein AGMMS49960_17530 [Betaproteobacteria bacterium]GHU16941.1 hypothetical protein AGMMS50243_04270 [Betaproteobacteria bacterium]GHV87454.1 hypothetical protein AGMMS50255_7500 [Spirochaetia bacterium]
MLHHFNCISESGNPGIGPLVFDWNDETGEVTGPSAGEILAAFTRGYVSLHPDPREDRDLSSTRNRSDMAAVVGYLHRLPLALADAYPQLEEDTDPNIYDMEGNVLGQCIF